MGVLERRLAKGRVEVGGIGKPQRREEEEGKVDGREDLEYKEEMVGERREGRDQGKGRELDFGGEGRGGGRCRKVGRLLKWDENKSTEVKN